jgi:hypothetical protein
VATGGVISVGICTECALSSRDGGVGDRGAHGLWLRRMLRRDPQVWTPLSVVK